MSFDNADFGLFYGSARFSIQGNEICLEYQNFIEMIFKSLYKLRKCPCFFKKIVLTGSSNQFPIYESYFFYKICYLFYQVKVLVLAETRKFQYRFFTHLFCFKIALTRSKKQSEIQEILQFSNMINLT